MSKPKHGSREWFVGEMRDEMLKRGVTPEVADKTLALPELQHDIDAARKWGTLGSWGAVTGHAIAMSRRLFSAEGK